MYKEIEIELGVTYVIMLKFFLQYDILFRFTDYAFYTSVRYKVNKHNVFQALHI